MRVYKEVVRLNLANSFGRFLYHCMTHNIYEVSYNKGHKERGNSMDVKVEQLLKDNSLTLRDISEQSLISETMLSSAFSKPIDTWSVRVLKALAKSLNLRIDELDAKLSAKPFTLDVDEDKHMIQGVKVPNDLFFSVYSSVNFNVMEGWQPSANDIENLVNQMQQSDVTLDEEINKLWTK